MNFLQLKYFQAVAECEHMTKAAQALNVSQPALSNMISRLEKQVGVPLFDRQGRQIKLSAYGKTFLHRVKQAFYELEKGQREVEEMAGPDQGLIAFATTFPSILPFLLKEFLDIYPNAKFIQKQALLEKDIIQQLEKQEVNVCISTFPIIHADIEWLPLIEEEIFLSVPPSHHFADRKSIHLSEAADESFISLTQDYYFRELTDNFCRDAGFKPNIAYEIAEASIIQRLVELNLGVTFTPLFYATRFSQLNSVQLKIEKPECKRIIGLAWHKGHYISQSMEQFLNFCQDFFKKSIQ